MWYVYDLINEKNEIEYVGYSKKPKDRFAQHTTHKQSKGNSNGKFYGRTDLRFELISCHANRIEAGIAEGQRKLSLGMVWDELEGRKKSNLVLTKEMRSKGGRNNIGKSGPKVICPNCGKERYKKGLHMHLTACPSS